MKKQLQKIKLKLVHKIYSCDLFQDSFSIMALLMNYMAYTCTITYLIKASSFEHFFSCETEQDITLYSFNSMSS